MNPRLSYSLKYFPVPPDEKNADNIPYAIDAGHQTPYDDLHAAAARGDIVAMQAILRQNPEALNRFHSLHGTTPLCWAIMAEEESAMNLLLEYFADVLLTPLPFINYQPLHFLDLTEEYSRSEVIDKLFATIDTAIKDACIHADKLPPAKVVNLLQTTLLLLRHEYYSFTGEIENRILVLKGILDNCIAPVELKTIYKISILHLQQMVYDELVETTPNLMSQAIADLALLLREELERELAKIPHTLRCEDLSMELVLYASSLREAVVTHDNFILLCYSIADQLALGGSLHLRAAIHLQKALHYCELETYPTKDVNCMIEVRQALFILKDIDFKNLSLAELLFDAALQIAANTDTDNTPVLFEMLALVPPLSPKNSLTNRAIIAYKLLNANLQSEFNQSNRVFQLLSEVGTLQFNDTRACNLKQRFHMTYVEDTIKAITNTELRRLPTQPKLSLDILRNSVYIVTNYIAATEDPQLVGNLHNIIYDFSEEFYQRILKHGDIVLPLKPLFEDFFVNVITITNNLYLKAAYAYFHIKMSNTGYAMQLYQKVLVEALASNWDFFHEVLSIMHKVTRAVCGDEALANSFNVLSFTSKPLLRELSLQTLGAFKQGYVNTLRLPNHYAWLAELYGHVASKIINEHEKNSSCSTILLNEFKLAIDALKPPAISTRLQSHGMFANPDARQTSAEPMDGLANTIAGTRLAVRL